MRARVAPNVGSVSPTPADPGVQVTVTGAGFGYPQGAGTVWLGTMPGTVVSWSDTQIVATVASNSTSGTVRVLQNGLFSNTLPFTVNSPTISNVSPPSGEAGTQVTITGSGFGSQSTGSVWLGTTPAAVVSWTPSQIMATVSPIARSGSAQVMQNGVSSNAVSFSVLGTATITSVVPPSGVPGTQVTINGSGFGLQQGNGQVFLGTASGSVQSWSDSQVTALVTANSTSGKALILQNGVTSNTVPFAVDSLHITRVTPNVGGPGTSVTITGTGFGWNQNSGTVTLGSANGAVMSWSDNQITAVVDSNAVSGVARVQQNNVWSNAVSFTIPASSTTIISPNAANLVVGQTQSIQALDATGLPQAGLTWSSSDPKIVSLSADDPPILTAVAPGHATVTGGAASADITVYNSGTQPEGTVLWSNPGDGSGVTNIVPAVPSVTGVADVFALNGDCNVQALKSDGTAAWTANIGQTPQFALPGGAQPCNEFLADFQGGVVVKSETRTPQFDGSFLYQYQLQRFDGITGQPYPPSRRIWKYWATLNPPAPGWAPGFYGFFVPPFVAHTDGTIFTLGPDLAADPSVYNLGGLVSVIDPLTGLEKAGVQAGKAPTQGNDQRSDHTYFDGFGNLIVAGDGYAYVPYSYHSYTWPWVCIPEPQSPGACQSFPPCTHTNIGGISNTYDSAYTGTVYLNLLRMDTAGNSSSIPLGSWGMSGDCYGGMGVSPTNAYAITNADQGAMMTWELDAVSNSSAGQSRQITYYSATTSGENVVSQSSMSSLVQPVLQAQDGSFYGSLSATGGMVKFDKSGNVEWSVPGDAPQIATADNGVIGASGITYDGNGNATELLGSTSAGATSSTTGAVRADAVPNATAGAASNTIGDLVSQAESWIGNEYEVLSGAASQLLGRSTSPATPDWASFKGANRSQNNTSPPCVDERKELTKEYRDFASGFIPDCRQFKSQQTMPPSVFSFQQINTSDINFTPPDHPGWALVQNYFLTGLASFQEIVGQSLTITSAYRTPLVQHAKSSHPHDRHVHGDAVDVASTDNNYLQLRADALQADSKRTCVETLAQAKTDCAKQNGPCDPENHVHLDWRRLADPPPPPKEACPASWMQLNK